MRDEVKIKVQYATSRAEERERCVKRSYHCESRRQTEAGPAAPTFGYRRAVFGRLRPSSAIFVPRANFAPRPTAREICRARSMQKIQTSKLHFLFLRVELRLIDQSEQKKILSFVLNSQ